MLTLSAAITLDKNKTATDSAYLLCLEVDIPGLSDTIKLVRNTDDIVWNGHTWQAFPFELDELGAGAAGEVPQVNLRVANASRAIERYLIDYDNYLKSTGSSEKIIVNIYVVNSNELDDPTSVVEHQYILRQPTTTTQWATFQLSADNPFKVRIPRNRILKNHCGYAFKGDLCQYAGAETLCNRTYTRCTELSNKTNFGGFLGAGTGGLSV